MDNFKRQTQTKMVRVWNRFMVMGDDRITKNVFFLWNRSLCGERGKRWSIMSILDSVDLVTLMNIRNHVM